MSQIKISNKTTPEAIVTVKDAHDEEREGAADVIQSYREFPISGHSMQIVAVDGNEVGIVFEEAFYRMPFSRIPKNMIEVALAAISAKRVYM